MKIVLCSVGKAHEPSLKTAIEDFSNRISKYFPVEWQLITPQKNAAALPQSDLKKQEAKAVLQWIDAADVLILLDEKGKQLSSPELAELIQLKANISTKRLVFLIGGAFGVDESIIQRSSFSWSLSKLVFPHMLVRLILAEQVYRACTILRNEKYHHN